MVPAYRQETREYMNFGVPSVSLTRYIKKVASLGWKHCIRTVASSLEVARVVITATPTSAYSLVQVPHKCGTAILCSDNNHTHFCILSSSSSP